MNVSLFSTNKKKNNNNYLQMYQQIDVKFKEGITVMDYLKSIRYRRETC